MEVLRSPSDTARTPEAVARLLRDLGPRLRRGGAPRAPHSHLPTGIPDIDQLLGGGFPSGRLSEISGPFSSGRTSLALASLAQTTGAGEVVAVVDSADAFDPASAEAAGVVLDRVLWVRARRLREALRSAERILIARGFALVLLDLASADLRTPPAAWPRLARLAEGTGACLIVLSLERSVETHAEIAIEMKPSRANFSSAPALLENLEAEVAVVRHRAVPIQRTAFVRLRATRAA